MNITLNDIDDLKKHLSEAVTTDVKATLDPMLADIKNALAKVPGLEADVKQLKDNQKKALAGFGLIATGTAVGGTMLFNTLWAWVRGHLHLS